jgi:hypothetical protein
MDGTTYRPSRPLMLGSILLTVLLGCLALVFLVGLFVSLFRGDFGDAAFAGFDVVAAGAFAALMSRQSRLRIVANEEDLTVVNYLSRFHLPWTSIARFDSSTGYFGIRAIMKDGRIVSLNAVQKWNLAVWLHRLTRADVIANELNERRAQ